jgi:glycosyltransferase involved in cell wall biosynthesis
MAKKTVAIYTNSSDVNAGGGMVYILALAKVLQSKSFKVTVFVNFSISASNFNRVYDTFGIQIELLKRGKISVISQIHYALKEWIKYDIVIEQSLFVPRIVLVKKSFILCDFPMEKITTWNQKVRLKSWNKIVVNSEFTKFWVQEYWKRSSIVIYPPTPQFSEDISNKIERNGIVSIGRFNKGKRSKRQDIIIEVFLYLIENKKIDCNLHLIGFVQDQEYLNELKKKAKGFSVYFHENCSSEKKRDILQNSALYISACGFGINENKNPSLVEHYGISVVEAMASGCVPLVVGNGGHKETVDHGINGFHWSTKKELANHMTALLSDKILMCKFQQNAILKSNRYSLENLEDEIISILVKN